MIIITFASAQVLAAEALSLALLKEGAEASTRAPVLLVAMSRQAAAAMRSRLQGSGVPLAPAGVDAALDSVRGAEGRALWVPQMPAGQSEGAEVAAQIEALCGAAAYRLGGGLATVLLSDFDSPPMPDLAAVRAAGGYAVIQSDVSGGPIRQRVLGDLRRHLRQAASAEAPPRPVPGSPRVQTERGAPAGAENSEPGAPGSLEELLSRDAGRLAVVVQADGAIEEVRGDVGAFGYPGGSPTPKPPTHFLALLDTLHLALRQPLRAVLDEARATGRPAVRDRLPLAADASVQLVVVSATPLRAAGATALLIEQMGLPLPLGLGDEPGATDAHSELVRELKEVRQEHERVLSRLESEQRRLRLGKAEVEALTRRVENSERLLRRTLDALPIFVGVLATDGTVMDVNRTALEQTGAKPEEVLSVRFDQALWWRHDEAIRREVRRGITLAAGGKPHAARLTFMPGECDPDPARARVVDHRTAPLTDGDANVTHLLVTGIDVTDQVAAERRSTERRLKLDAALSCGRLGMWEWNPETDQNEMDPLARELWGYGPSDTVRGQITIGRIHPDDRPRVQAELERVIAGEAAFDSTFRVVHDSGRELKLAGRGDALRDFEGRIRGIFGLNWEI